jgi:hypothetical protein
MSIGTAIFLSSFVIGLVLLYGFTRDRWRWRRIIVGFVSAMVLLVGGVAGFIWWTGGREDARMAEREIRVREQHQVHIGDELPTVVRRHGPPDTTVHRESGEITFGYRPRYGSVGRFNKVFHFDADSSLADIRFIGDAQYSIEYGWIPEDGVQLGLEREEVFDLLGPPCAEEFNEQFTRLTFPTEDAAIVRYLRLGHGEQQVSLHGWARRSCPSANKTSDGEVPR